MTLAVAHLGPDPADGGGMPAVIRDLARGQAADHRVTVIPTHRVGGIGLRLWVFARALARLARFALGRPPGGRPAGRRPAGFPPAGREEDRRTGPRGAPPRRTRRAGGIDLDLGPGRAGRRLLRRCPA